MGNIFSSKQKLQDNPYPKDEREIRYEKLKKEKEIFIEKEKEEDKKNPIVKGNLSIKNGKEILRIPIEPQVTARGSLKMENATEFYSSKKGKIYASSFDQNLMISPFKGLHPIVEGYYEAYCYHLPIVLSPDIIWILITQQFTHHVLKNSEKLRYIFVNFEKKKKLAVINSAIEIEGISPELWAKHITEFSDKIKDYVSKEVTDLIVPDFSTTDDLIKTIGKATLMCSMQKYFEYKVCCLGCGLPYINLEGSLEDWEKIKEKFLQFKKYDLTWWVERVEKIIDKIILTKKDPENIDRIFWKHFIFNTYGSVLASGTKYPTESIGGWIFELFPFDKYGDKRLFKLNQRKYVYEMDEELYITIDKDHMLEEFPCDLLETPITVIEVLKDYNTVETKLVSGFIGMNQDIENNNEVKPVFGWMVVPNNDIKKKTGKDKEIEKNENKEFVKEVIKKKFEDSNSNN